MSDDQSEVVYRIDRNDLLVFFNNQWDRFALDNEGRHLTSGNINKSLIWDFIYDAETRHLHEVLLKRVRANNLVRNLPFRCDSPSLRRFMEMDIVPLVDGVIEYRCRVIEIQPRKPVPLVTAQVHNGVNFLRMCSWCKKVEVDQNSWVEIEDAIRSLDLFAEAVIPQVSHTICDACLGDYDADD